MTVKPLFEIKFNEEALAELKRLGEHLSKAFESIRSQTPVLSFPDLLGSDWIEAAEKRYEEELALRRDEAARLTRAARVYGYRDAKVVWMTEPDKFAFIHLDGLICADIPIIGEDYETALHWIRLEADGQHG